MIIKTPLVVEHVLSSRTGDLTITRLRVLVVRSYATLDAAIAATDPFQKASRP